jgi:hypothetical protein
MPAKEPHQKTIQVHGVRYIVHERSGFTPWRICIKKDGNEHAYTPTFRTGWEDGGEVEIFSLLADYTDTILFQLRIYTKASSNDNVPETPHPTIAVQCTIPAFVFIEQEQKRILVQLMCTLTPLPEQRTTRITVDPILDL